MRKRKRLFFDIETAPCVLWAWRPGYNINVSYRNIIKEPAVICISWRWENTKKIHHLTWDKNQNDKEMLRKFIAVMEEADEVCGHNSESFDIRWLRTRALFHGLDMPPTFVSLDTWRDAKRYFRFNSNSLDYISKFLNVSTKRETSKDLWSKVVFNKDAKSLREMVKYCNDDVRSQFEVFEKMKPYVQSKQHWGDYISDCPECGSGLTRESKRRTTAQGHWRVQLQCFGPHLTKKGQLCGKYHTVAASRYDKDAKI